ncbi:long-chain fatty acid--CoA ligase, partial [Corallococcus praedator]
HRNLAANSELMRAWNMPWLTRGDPELETLMLTALPLYHIYALSCCFLLSMRMGSTSYIIRNPRDTALIVETLAREKFHLLWGVNSTYASILQNPKSAAIDFSALRISIGGGSAIQRATALAWHRLTG